MPHMQPDEFKNIFNAAFGIGLNYHYINENKNEQLKLLEKRGIKQDTVDTLGANALHYAAQYGDMNLIKHLIYLGFKWSKNDNQGFSLLYYAVRAKNDAVIKGLGDLHFGFYLNNNNRTEIINCANRHYPESLNFLIDYYNGAFFNFEFTAVRAHYLNTLINKPLKNLINSHIPIPNLSTIVISYLNLEENVHQMNYYFYNRNNILFSLFNNAPDISAQSAIETILSVEVYGMDSLEKQLNTLLKQSQYSNKPAITLTLLQSRMEIGKITSHKEITLSPEYWNHLDILKNQNDEKSMQTLATVTWSLLVTAIVIAEIVALVLFTILGADLFLLAFFCVLFCTNKLTEANSPEYFKIKNSLNNNSSFFKSIPDVLPHIDTNAKADQQNTAK